jgi:hypothetical protein
MTRLLAACALAIGLLAAGASPSWACGDTPGFCPNPPPGHGCNWFTC